MGLSLGLPTEMWAEVPRLLRLSYRQSRGSPHTHTLYQADKPIPPLTHPPPVLASRSPCLACCLWGCGWVQTGTGKTQRNRGGGAGGRAGRTDASSSGDDGHSRFGNAWPLSEAVTCGFV